MKKHICASGNMLSWICVIGCKSVVSVVNLKVGLFSSLVTSQQRENEDSVGWWNNSSASDDKQNRCDADCSSKLDWIFNVGVVETHFKLVYMLSNAPSAQRFSSFISFFNSIFWLHSSPYPRTYSFANWLPRRHFIFYFPAEVIIVMRNIAV